MAVSSVPMTNPDTPPDGLDLDDVLFEQAVAAHESGRLDEAERLYREVLRREPEDSAVHELLGQILVARGSIDGAIKHLRRSVSIDPGSQGAWTALAMALESAGDWTEALEAVDRGLQLGPGDVVARVTRVLLMSRCGDPRVALMEMASILEEPTLSVTHARLLAKVARAASDPQLLWRAMERIDRLDDREFDDVHAIARAEWQSGRLDRVEVCLRRLHEERPAHSEVALNLAGLLANSGRARQGVEVLRRSLEGAPQDAKLRMLLASLLDRVGEVEEAQRARSAGGMDSFPMLFAEAAGCLREGYQSAEEINASRDRLETLIQRASDALSLDSETDRLAAMEAAMQVSFFKLPAQGLPDRSVSESIAEILSRIVASVRPEAVAAPRDRRTDPRGRAVGLLPHPLQLEEPPRRPRGARPPSLRGHRALDRSHGRRGHRPGPRLVRAVRRCREEPLGSHRPSARRATAGPHHPRGGHGSTDALRGGDAARADSMGLVGALHDDGAPVDERLPELGADGARERR